MFRKTMLVRHCEGGTTEAIPFPNAEIVIALLLLLLKNTILRNSSH